MGHGQCAFVLVLADEMQNVDLNALSTDRSEWAVVFVPNQRQPLDTRKQYHVSCSKHHFSKYELAPSSQHLQEYR